MIALSGGPTVESKIVSYKFKYFLKIALKSQFNLEMQTLSALGAVSRQSEDLLRLKIDLKIVYDCLQFYNKIVCVSSISNTIRY